MLISTISTTIDHEIILGNGTYADSITITNTGAILSLGTDGIGIYVGPSISNAVIVNDGTIIGGPGGAGIYLHGTSATLTNAGLIEDGVAINGGNVDLFNSGIITGANGIHSGGTSAPTPTAAPLFAPSQACFAAGTAISAPGGARPVESLTQGQLVDSLHGPSPIKWIGRRHIDITTHPAPETVRPICIKRGALAPGVPARQLFVSPDHALFLNQVLVPAKSLINGRTIFQTHARRVTYYHVELDRHGVIFAEAVPCETYLETGNRDAFENAGTIIKLHPDFAQSIRERTSCAPFAEHGTAVEAARRNILARAGITMTHDPAWHIDYARGGAVIKSRTAIPGHITPDPRDCRCLGIKIANLTIGGRSIDTSHPALVQGWHAPEPDGRWTNGNAHIPASLLGGSRIDMIKIIATVPYPLTKTRQPQQRRAGSAL